MTVTTKNWIVGMLGLLIGGFAGILIAAYALAWFQLDGAYSGLIANSKIQLGALVKLQEGDPAGAIEILDIALKGNLISLEPADDRLSDSQREDVVQLMRQVDEYRTTFNLAEENKYRQHQPLSLRQRQSAHRVPPSGSD